MNVVYCCAMGRWIIILLITAPEHYSLSKYSLYKHCEDSSGVYALEMTPPAVGVDGDESEIRETLRRIECE